MRKSPEIKKVNPEAAIRKAHRGKRLTKQESEALAAFRQRSPKWSQV